MNNKNKEDVDYVAISTAELDGLTEKRIEWENGEFARSNDTLHGLLAGNLGVYLDGYLKATEAGQKAIRGHITKRMQSMGVRVQTTSPTITLMVKMVFGSDRKRAEKYAYVLRAAISENQTADTFKQWIKDIGGIEEVRRKITFSEETTKKREQLAESTLKVIERIKSARADALGTVTLNQSVQVGDTNILIADRATDGTLRVVGVLAEVSETLMNRVQDAMGKVEYEKAIKGKELGSTSIKVDSTAYGFKPRPLSSLTSNIPVPAVKVESPKMQSNAST